METYQQLFGYLQRPGSHNHLHGHALAPRKLTVKFPVIAADMDLSLNRINKTTFLKSTIQGSWYHRAPSLILARYSSNFCGK